MSITMRAKFQVNKVEQYAESEKVFMNAVARSSAYPADGSDEDNTYAKFSPSGTLELTIANPALRGKVQAGKKFYLDFTEV
jgi:hypothetical protein